MAHEKEQGQVAGEAKPQRMLYEKCPICDGELLVPPSGRFCICKTGYVPVGVVSQLEHLAQVDKLRRECGITMAMLREGRCGPIEKPEAP